MVICQHAKIFFKNRQKTTNGLMAFCDKDVTDDLLALEIWLMAFCSVPRCRADGLIAGLPAMSCKAALKNQPSA